MVVKHQLYFQSHAYIKSYINAWLWLNDLHYHPYVSFKSIFLLIFDFQSLVIKFWWPTEVSLKSHKKYFYPHSSYLLKSDQELYFSFHLMSQHEKKTLRTNKNRVQNENIIMNTFKSWCWVKSKFKDWFFFVKVTWIGKSELECRGKTTQINASYILVLKNPFFPKFVP